MATITWTSAASANWTDATSWGGTVPTSADDALVQAAAIAPYTITIDSLQAALSLTIDDGLALVDIANGGTLQVNSLSAQGGTIEVDGGGTLISATGVSLLGSTANLFSGVLQGGLAIGAGSTANLFGSPVFTDTAGTGSGTLLLTADTAQVTFFDSETIDNVSIIMFNPTGSAAVSAAAASDLTIGTGAVLAVSTGGTDSFGGFANLTNLGLISMQAGVLDLGAGGNFVDSGTINVAGGQLQFSATSSTGNTGTVHLSTGGTVSVQAASMAGETFQFDDANGTLILAAPTAFAGTVGGFGTGDVIDFGTNDVTLDGFSGGQVQLHTATDNFAITLNGSYDPALFSIAPNGSGGTELLTTQAAPCFVTGSRIMTRGGEVAVERLAVGDMAVTMANGAMALRRVQWIGRTRLDLDRHPAAERAAPIRILADAFAPGVPHRDLVLSPEHSVFVDGSLVPVHLLVNGATIRREAAAGVVTYWHVELDRHAVLLAEGLQVESYLDTGNRGIFENGGAPRQLHPAFSHTPDLAPALAIWAERGCAPLLLDGTEVDAIHRRLRLRADELGYSLTENPGLSVEADGVPLPMTANGADAWRVALPAGTAQIRLRSRATVPAALDRTAVECRRLGVALASVAVDGRRLALDGPEFVGGCHMPEAGGGWRWTDGDAVLQLGGEARVLEIGLASFGLAYWQTELQAAGTARASA